MCSYCGCRAIDSIARLSGEHEQIVNMIGSVRRSINAGDVSAARSALRELSVLLATHTRAEERGVFAELRRLPEFTAHIDSLTTEHRDLRDLLERLESGTPAIAVDAERALRRHIDREENGLFPAAAVALDRDAWDRVDQITRPS